MTENAIGMKDYKKNIILLLALFSASIYADDLALNSFPSEADVFVKNTKTGKEVKVGQTPLKIPLSQLLSYAQDRVFVLKVKKYGHVDYRVLLTNVESTDIELNVKLNVDRNLSETRNFDKLVSGLFEVQRLIRVKNYSESLTLLADLEKQFPHYSIISELKGGAYYLKKDFKAALGAYRKAFSLNPDNVDAYRMKIYLEKSFNLAQVNNG